MTAKKDLKRIVRERQAKTGESYTAALSQVRAKVSGGGGVNADGTALADDWIASGPFLFRSA